VLLPPGSEVYGRDRIVRYFAPGPRRVNLRHAMESAELRVTGDVAIDVGTWSNRWRIGEGEVQEAADRYLVVWRRGADGRWRIEYDMWHRPSA
jgi:ketosteroid isomerase-like protein